MIVMKCWGFPSGKYCEVDGQYLKSYDPEAHQGLGNAEFTKELQQAIQFDTVEEALKLYRTVPKSCPLRGDGQPNRPLTEFSMEFLHLESAVSMSGDKEQGV